MKAYVNALNRLIVRREKLGSDVRGGQLTRMSAEPGTTLAPCQAETPLIGRGGGAFTGPEPPAYIATVGAWPSLW